VQLGEPLEREIAAPGHETEWIAWVEVVDDGAEGMGKDEIDAADGPQQHGDKRPEAECAMQIPVDALPSGAPLHRQPAPPLPAARPPDDGARDAEHSSDETRDDHEQGHYALA